MTRGRSMSSQGYCLLLLPNMRWNCLEQGDTRVPSTPRLPVPHLKSMVVDGVVEVEDGLDEDREGKLASRSCDKCVAASNHTRCP